MALRTLEIEKAFDLLRTLNNGEVAVLASYAVCLRGHDRLRAIERLSSVIGSIAEPALNDPVALDDIVAAQAHEAQVRNEERDRVYGHPFTQLKVRRVKRRP